ncbi:MAG TPA: class I SAM-dependent methyltransferase [Dehalococcoidia bacterium]|jgi:ubiquinone/menaquinone biosynthesis C-methylase UbiE|nr:class I SAM-dependent methyltransferase [Dehalococcoidia bacterium]
MTSVKDYFREIASVYDSIALRAMPRYEEMLSEIVRCLPVGAGDILELGCGTGALTALLAQQYTDANLTAVDAAPEMIEIARDRLNRTGVSSGRVSFTVSLFEKMSLPDGSYDLVASNMSLHHIADKPPFYERMRRSLRPGGYLVLGDELKTAISHVQRLNWDGWLEFASQPGHLDDKQIAAIIQHDNEFDHYETLPDQIQMLAGAGFRSVDCVWRWTNYAILIAEA